MKKVFSSVICVMMLFALVLTVSAAPDAEVSMTVTNAVREGDDVILTVDISIGSSAEPYASLDFNLVSSDSEQLSVAKKNSDGDADALDISFVPEYGGAYHKGRIDDASGEIRYLVGVYAQSSGNIISDATNLCTVKLRYSGEEMQTLSIEDMRLVYKNASGEIVGAVSEIKSPKLDVDERLLNVPYGNIEDTEVPLDDAKPVNFTPYILTGLVLATLVIYFMIRRKKAA